MVKKIITAAAAAAVIITAGGMMYADACGVFLRDNEAAKSLVSKYMNATMKSYQGIDNVSFRGIVKEGCDFWYYNDYNNDVIYNESTSAGTVTDAEYSLCFNAILYSDRCYTIDADVTQNITYDGCQTITKKNRHIFTVEQSGRDMYITNDLSNGSDMLLLPETSDVPSAN